LLYLSLLVQATTAMTRAGTRKYAYGGSRTRSFRQSFLHAFAVRIGQRLRAIAADAARTAQGGGASGLLPVLAARDEAVRQKVHRHFPEMTYRSIGTVDLEGWSFGTAAADQAVIQVGAGRLSAT
jgi:hypothetical protein